MTEAELAAIEQRLSVVLPVDYREFLRHYPSDLVTAKKDLGWVKESPSEREFVNSSAQLIEFNEDVRRPGTPWIPDDGPWPERYFVIGDDQCGNYWCIDQSGSKAGVWFYNHDTGGFEHHFDSLDEFAAALLRDVESWGRE